MTGVGLKVKSKSTPLAGTIKQHLSTVVSQCHMLQKKKGWLHMTTDKLKRQWLPYVRGNHFTIIILRSNHKHL